MPLKLHLVDDSKLPIDASKLSQTLNTDTFDTRPSREDVASMSVVIGNRKVEIGDCFTVTGDLTVDRELRLSGDLARVHNIGRKLTNGKIVACGSVGRHAGSGMSGGEVIIQGNAGDFLGAEMCGGVIRVTGNAGHCVGANLAGGRYGINGGEILITGNTGNALGRRMRRGLIFVGGDAGKLAAWEMLAGTMIIAGRAGEAIAANISRGTVVLAGGRPEGDVSLSCPQFTQGATYRPSIINFICHWLTQTFPESVSAETIRKLKQHDFVQYNGVQLNNNRAEIFVAADSAGGPIG
jgi:formylmethanofuran dehydrogenase subunit C